MSVKTKDSKLIVTFSLIGAAVACFTISPVVSAEEGDGIPAKQLKEKLKSDKFAEGLVRERAGLIKGLLVIVNDNSSPMEARVRAVDILGKIRATEAVGSLLKHISIIMPEGIEEKTIETMYPCVRALADIGNPGSRESLATLPKTADGTKRLLLVTVIERVEGAEVAQFLIKKAMSSCEDEKEKGNLGKALKIVEDGMKE